jgi:hypothetical protein
MEIHTLLRALAERFPAVHLTRSWSWRDFDAVTEIAELRGGLR